MTRAEAKHRWFVAASSALVLTLVTSCGLFDEDRQTGSSAPLAGGCELKVDAEATGHRAEILTAVSGDRAGQVWAVGVRYAGSRPAPVITRWTGASWVRGLPEKNDFRDLRLEDVDARSADDVWAVGYDRVGPKALHWQGASWVSVPTATLEPHSAGNLFGVAVLAPDDAWAVGRMRSAGNDRPLIERWNGTSWRVVEDPAPLSHSSGLRDIAAIRTTSAWAVGWTVDGDGTYRTLIERWDGRVWRLVAGPPIRGDAVLSSVAARAPDDVWAIGWSWTQSRTLSLVLHWDGSTWATERLPSASGHHARPSSLSVAQDGVIAVGQAPNPEGVLEPSAFRWDGSAWSQIPVEEAGPAGGDLSGVTTLRDGTVIAVGSVAGTSGYRSLVERGC
jgi:hypothetical protein